MQGLIRSLQSKGLQREAIEWILVDSFILKLQLRVQAHPAQPHDRYPGAFSHRP